MPSAAAIACAVVAPPCGRTSCNAITSGASARSWRTASARRLSSGASVPQKLSVTNRRFTARMVACPAMRKLVVVMVAAAGGKTDPAPPPAPAPKPPPAPASTSTPDEIGAAFGKHLGAHDIDAAVAMFAPALGGKLTAPVFGPDWDKSIEGAGK